MKSTIISMLVVLVLLVVLPILFLGDKRLFDGISLDSPDSSSGAGVQLSSRIENVSTDAPVAIYRWRDANGLLQFSNTEPEGVAAELLQLEPNLSSMDPVKARPVDNTAATVSAPETGNPYTPGGMKEMVEQANELKKVLSQQQADQQQAIENILPKKR